MTDDLVAWLRGVLDGEAAQAPHAHERGCFVWDDFHYRHGTDLSDGQPGPENGCECSGSARAAARVEAERAILDLFRHKVESMKRYPEPANLGGFMALEQTLRTLAYGHRHDAPGYDPAWAPEGVEVAG